MAHNLHIGQKFDYFAAFESAIMRYQNAENVQFYRSDSRSVDKTQPRLEKKLNLKIKYICTTKLSTTVLTVGRNTFPRQQGLEKEVCSISNCYDFVSSFSVPFNSSALTSMRFNSLHCYIFFGVPHFFNFVFSLFLNKD